MAGRHPLRYPFDTCKVRLQASAGLYDGLGDVLRSVLREEGVSAASTAAGCPAPRLARMQHASLEAP
jgi:hypothetical protein